MLFLTFAEYLLEVAEVVLALARRADDLRFRVDVPAVVEEREAAAVVVVVVDVEGVLLLQDALFVGFPLGLGVF